MRTVTKEYLREYFRYEDGQLIAIKERRHSRVLVGESIGYLHSSGRFRAVLFGRKYGLHQLVWIYFYGTLPEYGIDHEDRNPANNRIGNLRPCTAMTNGQNTDGEHGVNFTRSRTWEVWIMINRKKAYLGTYRTEEEARAVRREAELEHYEYSPLRERNVAAAA